MTLEELWELFPIVLEPHREVWARWFEEESALLQSHFPDAVISHVGSTAVPGIMSKPTVDILMEFPSVESIASAASEMEGIGYIRMSESPRRISMNKGYTPSGYAERVFHFHLRVLGDNDEIRFRDKLISKPDVAKEYESLKVKLAELHKHNRDAYTEGKTEFILNVSSMKFN